MLFRCKRSGNTINIEQPDDIERMKTHEEYTQVAAQVSAYSQGEQHGMQEKQTDESTVPQAGQNAEAKVRRGRPPKQR
jgi:hypothetical protein